MPEVHANIHRPIKSPTHFLDLPPEIRNRIYRCLLSGTTIHVGGTAANPTNTYTLCISTCRAPLTDYLATKDLAGTSQLTLHGVNGTCTVTAHNTNGEICDSNQIFVSNHICRQRVELSTQVLRVNRQIYSEAALLPYAMNAFMFSGGMEFHFRTAFLQQFNERQRSAMRTAIVPALFFGQVPELPRMVPALKDLWLESPAPRRKDRDENKDEKT